MLWGRALLLWASLSIVCSGQKAWTEAERLEFLKKADIKKTQDAPDGITGTTRATLSDGTETHDVSIQTIDVTPWKPKAGSPPEPMFSDRYVYNIAAYELNRILGLNMIPATVQRSFQGTSGSFTWWVDNTLMTEKQRYMKKEMPPDDKYWNEQMYIVRMFDQLIYNVDRNLGNIVIDKDWKIWMIDHTRAFRPWKQIKEKKSLVKCDRVLLTRLRNLDGKELHEKLDPYITKEQVDGVLARASLIVKFFDDAIKKKGEGNVLYDYLPKPTT